MRQKQQAVFDKNRKSVLDQSPDCAYCQNKPSTQVDHVHSVNEVRGWVDEGKMTEEEAVKFLPSPKNTVGACGGEGGCNPSKGGKKLTLDGTDSEHWTPPNPTPEMKERIQNLDKERTENQ